jgi:3-deoxy-D-manno-octulosonate 8-phosphate phosphatase (KDO 8-P phosphatase)
MRIRCLVLDVDGVLTDGRLYCGAAAEPLRAFHIHDGLAIQWFLRLDNVVAIVTGKQSVAVARRAAELGVTHLVQDCSDKRAALESFLADRSIPASETAMIGDDLPDLAAMNLCGMPIAVPNAAPEVRRAARWVTTRAGGQGAVREAIVRLLRENEQWNTVLGSYGIAAEPRPALVPVPHD